jgi:Fe-S-cluster containining protein
MAHAAGSFSAWLRAMRDALAGGPGMQVACGECVGCCTSSYVIKVRPHERDALAHIPVDALVGGEPDGTRYMPARPSGHCPMFSGSARHDAGCSIYAHRPQTCRTYDCRIFTAAGMQAGDAKSMINERIASWRFDYEDEGARREHRAVIAAANYLRQHPVRFPNGEVPSRASDIAVLALKSYGVFMSDAPEGEALAGRIVAACREFDARAAGRS